ncbi:HAMP domain-containing histidine kinase [candidate division KSB1 bacterium]|nr:HAMP domain-containing histidine kinase [candidate division KSB1 bacterium]
MILFMILIPFLFSISIVNQMTIKSFVSKTEHWYQQDSAEKLANQTAISFELLVENTAFDHGFNTKFVNAFNMLLGQSILQEHVLDVCILISVDDQIKAIDDGNVFYSHIFNHNAGIPASSLDHSTAIETLGKNSNFFADEQIYSVLDEKQSFHIFVPLMPKGELVGAAYMHIMPDFSFISKDLNQGYVKLSLLFTGLMLFGFAVLIFLSTRSINERDKAFNILMQEQKKQLIKDLHHQKEAFFTRRIYHTHHKAEKIMGFIKEDLRTIPIAQNIAVIEKISKYANFISRVIYDMKWYNQPLHAIRGPAFNSDINAIICFLIENVFKRVSSAMENIRFNIRLDDKLPIVHINEFVIWEIFEPLVQNAIDHGAEETSVITIQTRYAADTNQSIVTISDDGPGIPPELLKRNKDGVKLLFQENTTTKQDRNTAGFGCFIAYEIATQRCGWLLDAENLPFNGSRFTLTIQN